MSESTQKSVPSNGSKDFGIGIPAVILFPSLGAPVFLQEEKGEVFLHLILLSKENLEPAEINERLRFFEDFSAVSDFKRKPVPRSPEPPPKAEAATVSEPVATRNTFCETADPISREKIAKPASEVVIDDLNFRGFLNEKTVKFWQKSGAIDSVHLSTLYRVKINVSKEEAILKRRKPGHFFIHWADIGTGHPVGRQGAQEKILYKVLKDKDSNFIGDRLWNSMVEANNKAEDASLPCLDMNGFEFDSEVPLSHYHPVYFRPRQWIPDPAKKDGWKSGESPKDALNLAVLSDLHLVAKFQLLQNSKLRVENSEQIIKNLTERDKTPWHVKDMFPEIGSLISESVQVLESHFNAIANDRSFEAPDAVLLVGDLIDFHRESFPEKFSTLESPKKDEGSVDHGKRIWDAVAVPSDRDSGSSRKAALKKNFQFGVSYLGIFHLVADFVSRSAKPVFLLPGNHDGYIDPFGISPRLTFDDAHDTEEYMKANEGIACDSNLTFLEATTAFGPTYGNKVQNKDFDENVMELFYLLFSPFKTWSCIAGAKQPLVLLDWGNDEMMFTHMEDSKQEVQAGHLPHANRSIPQAHRALVSAVIAKHPGTAVTLVSHFTYACYEPGIPLSTKCNLESPQGAQNVQEFHEDDVQSKEMDTVEGAVQGGLALAAAGALIGAAAGGVPGALVGAGIGLATGVLAGGGLANYAGVNNLLNGKNVRLPNGSNYGTFHKGRKEIFEWIEKGHAGGIAMTISGHAHRAAFYTFEDRRNWTEISTDSDGNEIRTERKELRVRGWHLEEYSRAAAQIKNKCLMVVSDSAGPIPRRNHNNELEGWGSQRPSWTRIAFRNELQPYLIESVFTSFPASRPRLAVALDYLESTVVRSMSKFEPGRAGMVLAMTFVNMIGNWLSFKREVSKTAFPGSLTEGGDKPLWVVDSYGFGFHATEKDINKWSGPGSIQIKPDELAPQALSANEAVEVFSSNLLTCFVSERITSIHLKDKEFSIQLFGNSTSIPFPNGCGVEKMTLLVNAGGWLAFTLVPKENGKWVATGASNGNFEMKDQKFAKLIGGQSEQLCEGWICTSFKNAGGATEYDVKSPWAVKVKVGFYKIVRLIGGRIVENVESQVRMIVYRDIWANERPDLDRLSS